MFFTKVTEYSAYGAASAVMVLFLQQDVMLNGSPLGDSAGYLYYMVWGLVATIITMMVGAVCDTIGVKKCLLIGAVALIVSRFFMPLSQDIFFVTFFGFLPLRPGRTVRSKESVSEDVARIPPRYCCPERQSSGGSNGFWPLRRKGDLASELEKREHACRGVYALASICFSTNAACVW